MKSNDMLATTTASVRDIIKLEVAGEDDHHENGHLSLNTSLITGYYFLLLASTHNT